MATSVHHARGAGRRTRIPRALAESPAPTRSLNVCDGGPTGVIRASAHVRACGQRSRAGKIQRIDASGRSRTAATAIHIAACASCHEFGNNQAFSWRRARRGGLGRDRGTAIGTGHRSNGRYEGEIFSMATGKQSSLHLSVCALSRLGENCAAIPYKRFCDCQRHQQFWRFDVLSVHM
jgi:hypothetical protein